jgi:hypothetical protein
MALKSFNGVCCTVVHVVAFAAAACSVYLFLGTSFENVLTAFVLFGLALALEAVAAVVGRDKTALP